jgi:hypothetical protein
MFLDIGAGLLIARLVSYMYAVPLGVVLMVGSVCCALFPDSDLIFSRVPMVRRVIGEHRGMMHVPFWYIVTAPAVYILTGPLYTSMWLLGVGAHLVHDTFFLGWGIAWLWPLSNKKISIFHDKDGRLTSHILVWGPEEDAAIRAAYASPHWIQDFYLRPNVILVLELAVFIAGIVFTWSAL